MKKKTSSFRLPTAAEAKLAKDGSRAIARNLKRKRKTVKIGLDDDSTVELPAAAFSLFINLLDQMAMGNSVAIVTQTAQLTTQEAADGLNVSRPYLIKLLEEGKIPFHYVGRHRRVTARDLFAYKEASLARSQRLLDKLTELSEEGDNNEDY